MREIAKRLHIGSPPNPYALTEIAHVIKCHVLSRYQELFDDEREHPCLREVSERVRDLSDCAIDDDFIPFLDACGELANALRDAKCDR